MANTANNIKDVGSVIAKIAATMLADKTQFLQNIDKEPAESFDQVNGYNVGQTITISKPARFVPTTNPDITAAMQDVVEEKTTLTLNNRQIVGVNLTSAEIQNTLRLKDWSNRILDPAVSSIAQAIEAQFLAVAKNATFNTVANTSLVPGSAIFDTDTLLAAREKLMKNLAPNNGKFNVLLDSTSMRSAVNARKGLFANTSKIAEQYVDGQMGQSDGFNFYENNLLPTHARGSAAGAITVTTTVAEGATTINLTGTGTQTLNIGDVITFSNSFAVHPITKAAYPYLAQFVVQATNTAAAGAYTAVQISPAFYAGSNGLQNITALPASGNTVTVLGVASSNYLTNLAFHKSAFRFASVPLMRPDGAHMVGQETVDGMTIRVWMDAAILTDKMIMRLDFLGGICPVRPEWSVRLPY